MTLHGPSGGTESDLSPGVEAILATRADLPTDPRVGELYYIADERRTLICLNAAPGALIWETVDPTAGGFLPYDSTQYYPAGQIVSVDDGYGNFLLFMATAEIDPGEEPNRVGIGWARLAALPTDYDVQGHLFKTPTEVPTGDPNDVTGLVGDIQGQYLVLDGSVWRWNDDLLLSVAARDENAIGMPIKMVDTKADLPTIRGDNSALALGDYTIVTGEHTAYLYTGMAGMLWVPFQGAGTYIQANAEMWVKQFDFSAGGSLEARIDALVTGLEHGEAVRDFITTPLPGMVPDELWIVGTHPELAATTPDGSPNPFIGHANHLAIMEEGVWKFELPSPGEAHLVEGRRAIYSWNGTAWVKVATASSAFHVYKDITDFGQHGMNKLPEGDFFYLTDSGQMGVWKDNKMHLTSDLPAGPAGLANIGQVLRIGPLGGIAEWGFEHRFVTPTECPTGDPNDIVPPLPASEDEWVTTDSAAWKWTIHPGTYQLEWVDPNLGTAGAWASSADLPKRVAGVFLASGNWLRFGGTLWLAEKVTSHASYSWVDTGVAYVEPHWVKQYDFKNAGGEHLFLGPDTLPSGDPNDFLPIPGVKKGDHLTTDRAVWFWNTEPILAAKHSEGATGHVLGTIDTAADLPTTRLDNTPLGAGDIVLAKDTGYAHIYDGKVWSESSVPYTAANSAMWVKEFDFSSHLFYETDAAFEAAVAKWTTQPVGIQVFTRQHVWKFDETAATWNQVLEFAPTIFFGNGALTGITAPRYGMPADTTPDPETHTPQTDDIYFDVSSGVVHRFTGKAGADASAVSASVVVAPPVISFYDSHGIPSTPYPDPDDSGDLLIDTDADVLAAYQESGVWKDFNTDPLGFQDKISALTTGLEHGEAVARITNDPPPATGLTADELFIVGPTPTGVWVGHPNELALWSGTAWVLVAPSVGETHLVESDGRSYSWSVAGTWVVVSTTAVQYRMQFDTNTTDGEESSAARVQTSIDGGTTWVDAFHLPDIVMRIQNEKLQFGYRGTAGWIDGPDIRTLTPRIHHNELSGGPWNDGSWHDMGETTLDVTVGEDIKVDVVFALTWLHDLNGVIEMRVQTQQPGGVWVNAVYREIDQGRYEGTEAWTKIIRAAASGTFRVRVGAGNDASRASTATALEVRHGQITVQGVTT